MTGVTRGQRMKALVELDETTMKVLKAILEKKDLNDLENFLCHCLNIMLENNRTVFYSINGNFSMVAGSSIRNLLENWANLNYVLQKGPKKNDCAKSITETAFRYSRTLQELVNGKSSVDELYKLPKWTSSTIGQRVELLGDGPVFQYELLSRFTHADMWAAINDIIADKEVFWTNLLGWAIEAGNHTLFLTLSEVEIPDALKAEAQEVCLRTLSQLATVSADNKLAQPQAGAS